MTIYEFVTPSDPITFKAENDKVAFCCAVILGNGKGGCENTTTRESIPSLLAFSRNPDEDIEKFIGCPLKEFVSDNIDSIQTSFESFAYATVSERKTYDNAIEAITDPERLKEFKQKHEDQNRTSMSKWVQGAWNYAQSIAKNEKGS